jgi:RNA polymerase sigma factor (sigma-70 family)
MMMSGPPVDAELLRRAQDDAAAFEALYRRYVRQVMRYAACRCTQPADVADLVATTFVAVLESAATYDQSRGEVLPWILGIARHRASDQARRARREGEALARVAGWRALNPEELADIDARIDASRSRGDVEIAMQSLPRRYRDVLWLVGDRELSHAQAAEALGLAAPAFRMRLMRARRALSKALARPPHARAIGADCAFSLSEETQP